MILTHAEEQRESGSSAPDRDRGRWPPHHARSWKPGTERYPGRILCAPLDCRSLECTRECAEERSGRRSDRRLSLRADASLIPWISATTRRFRREPAHREGQRARICGADTSETMWMEAELNPNRLTSGGRARFRGQWREGEEQSRAESSCGNEGDDPTIPSLSKGEEARRRPSNGRPRGEIGEGHGSNL